MAQTLGFVDADGLEGLVQRTGLRLAADSERPSLPWEFHFVDDPTPNAFALAGGFIYATRGMITPHQERAAAVAADERDDDLDIADASRRR